jgi:hypothetical protein
MYADILVVSLGLYGILLWVVDWTLNPHVEPTPSDAKSQSAVRPNEK